jgi:hypothetical protein
MLDLTILRQPDGTMQFDVYRKPTHTDQYIPWDSDQPLQHKGSTILSLTRRANLLPSGPACQSNKLNRVHRALALNGYPPWAIKCYSYRSSLHHRLLPPLSLPP